MSKDIQETGDVVRLRQSLGELPEPVSRPFLVLVGGLPATGKSFFSRRLAQRAPAAILESDALRRVLVPRPNYSWQESRRLFRACERLVEDFLSEGFSVILDATNLKAAHRDLFYQAAERSGARVVVVWVEAPPALVWARLSARQQGLDPDDRSEADWTVYTRMCKTAEPPFRNFFRVNTARDIRPAIERVVKALKS